MVLRLRRRRLKIAGLLMVVMVAASASAWLIPSNHRRASPATTKKAAILKEPFTLTDFCPAIYQWAAAGFMAASFALTPLPSQAATDPPTGVRMEVETNTLIKSIQESKGELNTAISNIVKDKASADIQLVPPASKAEEVRDALNAGKESTKEEVKAPTAPEPKAPVKEDPKTSALVKVEDVPAAVKPEYSPSEFAPVEVKEDEPKQAKAKKAEPPAAEIKTQESKPVETKKEESMPAETKKQELKPTEEKKPETPPVEAKIEPPKPVEAKTDEPNPSDVKKETPETTDTEEKTKKEKPSSFSDSVLEKLKATIETPTIDEPKTEATKPDAPKPVEVKKAESKPFESKKEESKPSESKKEEPKPVDESNKDQSKVTEVTGTKLSTLKDLVMEKINENTPKEAPAPVLAPRSEEPKSVTTIPPPPGEDESFLKKKVYDWLFNYESPSEPRKIAIFDAQFWERPLIRTTFVSPDGSGDVNLEFTNGEVAAGTAIAVGVSYLVSYSLYDSERAEEERRAEAKRAAAAIKKKNPGYTVVNTDPKAKSSGTTSTYDGPSFVDRLASNENNPPTTKDSALNEISLQNLAKGDQKRAADDSYLDALSGDSSSNYARSKKETKRPGGGSYLDSL